MIMIASITGFTSICILFGYYLYNTSLYKGGFLKMRMFNAILSIWLGLMAWVMMLMRLIHELIGVQNLL